MNLEEAHVVHRDEDMANLCSPIADAANGKVVMIWRKGG